MADIYWLNFRTTGLPLLPARVEGCDRVDAKMEYVTIIVGVLGVIGGGPLWSLIDRYVIRWWYMKTWDEARVRRELERIIDSHVVRLDGPHNAATFGNPIEVEWFVDFLSAVTDRRQRDKLERCMTRWITLKLVEQPTKVEVPKLGNVILADAVARRLRVPVVIVRQDETTFVRGGDPFDGQIGESDRVVLIDDVASDAEFLMRCIRQLRRVRARLLGVAVLVLREEGSCVEVLREEAAFTYILAINDQFLQSIESSGHMLTDAEAGQA